jgi:phenylpyruvate tautomerase
MPLLKIQTNVDIAPQRRVSLMQKASARVAELLGKPERYVMISLEPGGSLLFDGSDQPLAYLELKSIGLPGDRTKGLSADLCQLISTELAIAPDRIYIEFHDAPRNMWGWNGSTFER